MNTNSFIGTGIYDENLWLGFENINETAGLKILLEVVAYTGQDNKETISKLISDTSNVKINSNSIEAEKKIKEAKELLELGVISKEDYNKVLDKYTPKMTKEEALDKLKNAKKQLDSGVIKQEEYDELKKKLTPIILGNN